MLEGCDAGTGVVYCDMLHNEYGWYNMHTSIKYSLIDVGCVLVQREIALEVGWKYGHQDADWDYIFEVAKFAKSKNKSIKKVSKPLFVHN